MNFRGDLIVVLAAPTSPQALMRLSIAALMLPSLRTSIHPLAGMSIRIHAAGHVPFMMED